VENIDGDARKVVEGRSARCPVAQGVLVAKLEAQLDEERTSNG